MFTGLIEEVGKIRRVLRKANSLELEIYSEKIINSVNLGDSISVNGICLTVKNVGQTTFKVDVSPETYSRTTLKFVKENSMVNLERALTLEKPLGGHFVLGHVDDIGRVILKKKLTQFYEFIIEFPNHLRKYIVEKGSIAIDGISLTVNKIFDRKISLMIIPHTYLNTNLQYVQNGDYVNIEVDIIGKYVENMVKFK